MATLKIKSESSAGFVFDEAFNDDLRPKMPRKKAVAVASTPTVGFNKLSLLTPEDCAGADDYVEHLRHLSNGGGGGGEVVSVAAVDEFRRYQFNLTKKVQDEVDAMFQVGPRPPKSVEHHCYAIKWHTFASALITPINAKIA